MPTNPASPARNLPCPLTQFTWGLDLSGQNGNAPPWPGGVSESPAGLHGAGGIGGLLAMLDTKNNQEAWDDVQHIFFYDANGNVGQVIAARAGSAYFGQTAARYEYYPFGGNLLSAFARGTSGQKNPFLFSTKYRDSETGLYYYGERYLLPRLGRWVNRDPVGERGSANLYAALRNNPTGWIDPDGREEQATTQSATSQATSTQSPRWQARINTRFCGKWIRPGNPAQTLDLSTFLTSRVQCECDALQAVAACMDANKACMDDCIQKKARSQAPDATAFMIDIVIRDMWDRFCGGDPNRKPIEFICVGCEHRQCRNYPERMMYTPHPYKNAPIIICTNNLSDPSQLSPWMMHEMLRQIMSDKPGQGANNGWDYILGTGTLLDNCARSCCSGYTKPPCNVP